MKGVRKNKQGGALKIVEFKCPRCKRRLLTSEAEAAPPQPGLVPYCHDCLKQGERIVLVRSRFRSGPPDLIV